VNTPGTTLRYQLLGSLLTPIVLVLLVSSVVSYFFSIEFTKLAYDNALFDNVHDISRQLHFRDGEVQVDLPRAAIDMLESDKDDRIYYMVHDTRHRLIAGRADLPTPSEKAPPGKPIFYDGEYHGRSVRIAALYAQVLDAPQHPPVLIQVAETLNKRHILTSEILLGMLVPELLFIMIICVLVWVGVERGLRPLAALQAEIRNRSHRDLSPLPEHNAPSEVRTLVHAMNELLGQLHEAISSQQRFVANAAHQLRTPLAGLKTQTEFALRQHDLGEVHQSLQQMSTATGQTTHLVNQLLSLARAEPNSAAERSMNMADLSELAREVTSEWVPRALERNIDLGYDAAAGTVDIKCDTLLVKEMMCNLIDNAIRYTQSGGLITVRVACTGDQASLQVEDNGPGIPVAERERAFERFFRGMDSETDGCGLGLAIVREIAHGHNAEVRIDSGAYGSGTRVSVVFPRTPKSVASTRRA
jgi:two-component system, OmpR family, sensor histidine kinase TctE